jgi:hypothetical protein
MSVGSLTLTAPEAGDFAELILLYMPTSHQYNASQTHNIQIAHKTFDKVKIIWNETNKSELHYEAIIAE